MAYAALSCADMASMIVLPDKESARLRKAHSLYLTLVKDGVDAELVEQVADLMRLSERVAS